MPFLLETKNNGYGPLPPQFSLEIPDGYSVLVGLNNSGKSSILQSLFSSLIKHEAVDIKKICLIEGDRSQIDASSESQGQKYDKHNQDLYSVIKNGPRNMSSPGDSPAKSLTRSLISNGSVLDNLNRLTELIKEIDLPTLNSTDGHFRTAEDVVVGFQGSGYIHILPILAALACKEIDILLIDEPEMSLEPRMQKQLALLLKEQTSPQKSILVATHSHLFLNRNNPKSNIIIEKPNSFTEAKPVATPQELFDLTFNLIGVEMDDLFFPRGYIITEGFSDQIIIERICWLLLGENAKKIRVFSASGDVEKAGKTLSDITNLLRPIIENQSPYKDRVFVLVDKHAQSNQQTKLEDLKRRLNQRLFELDEVSIEKEIPDLFYDEAGINKESKLDEIDATSDYKEKAEKKVDLAQRISQVITHENLDHLDSLSAPIREAAAHLGLNIQDSQVAVEV